MSAAAPAPDPPPERAPAGLDPAAAIPSLQTITRRQQASRKAFGAMLLCWRRRNGWTQYTAGTWAQQAGFATISSGNLSVIEQGKAGELRQKCFWQLWELNRRIAQKEWGEALEPAIAAKLQEAIPIGDSSCPLWGPVEFWACYCGLRPVPAAFRFSPPPAISQRKAAELSARWRRQLRRVVTDHNLDPSAAINQLVARAGSSQRNRFYAVLTGFGDYSSAELSALWQADGQYLPDTWLAQWEQAAGKNPAATQSQDKREHQVSNMD